MSSLAVGKFKTVQIQDGQWYNYELIQINIIIVFGQMSNRVKMFAIEILYSEIKLSKITLYTVNDDVSLYFESQAFCLNARADINPWIFTTVNIEGIHVLIFHCVTCQTRVLCRGRGHIIVFTTLPC